MGSEYWNTGAVKENTVQLVISSNFQHDTVRTDDGKWVTIVHVREYEAACSYAPVNKHTE